MKDNHDVINSSSNASQGKFHDHDIINNKNGSSGKTDLPQASRGKFWPTIFTSGCLR